MEVHDLTRRRINLEALGDAVRPLRSLGDLLDWARHLTPPVPSPLVLTQDEYTHDVLVPYPGGYWLDFDTT
jgi:hypothetical protein